MENSHIFKGFFLNTLFCFIHQCVYLCINTILQTSFKIHLISVKNSFPTLLFLKMILAILDILHFYVLSSIKIFCAGILN